VKTVDEGVSLIGDGLCRLLQASEARYPRDTS
jgi:hypothetical protein